METTTIADRLATCLDFDGVAVTASMVDVDGVAYVLTQGTGEGVDFAYDADEVEAWLDEREDAPADYSADFCNDVTPTDDVDVAFALAKEGYRLGRGGTCALILRGVAVESSEGLEDCENQSPMGGTIVDMSSGQVEIMWEEGTRTRCSLGDTITLA